MYKVYANADLTFSLTGSQDGEASMRYSRCDKDVEGTCLDDRWIVHEPRDIVWDELVESAHLSTRGWTLQEHLLSRRIIHLGAKQMASECRTAESMEPYSVFSTSSSGSGIARFWETVSAQNKLDYWSHPIEEYPRRDLGNLQDVLRAIDGIASTMRGGGSAEYLSGVWRQTLVNYPGESFAPTWSWASVHGPVQFPPTTHNFGREPSLSIGGATETGYIPLIELIVALPENRSATLESRLDEPSLFSAIVLEGWACALGSLKSTGRHFEKRVFML